MSTGSYILTGNTVVAGSFVPFDELNGAGYHGRAHFSLQALTPTAGQEIVRVGLIPWILLDQLILDCWPNPPSLPATHPSVPYLYLESLEWSPYPEDPVVVSAIFANTFQYARITARYSTIPYLTSDFITRKWAIGGEFMTLPIANLQWSDASVVDNSDLIYGKLVPQITHHLAWHFVAQIPWTAIRASLGCVNEKVFEGAAAETLLFLGAEIVWTVNGSGVDVYTLEYRFVERILIVPESQAEEDGTTVTWQQFWNPTEAKWMTIFDQHQNETFQNTDFAALFVQGDGTGD